MLKIVLKSKQNLLTDRFKVNFGLFLLDFLCRLYFSFRLSKLLPFNVVESQDKTGHVSPKEFVCLFCVVFQELSQKRQNLFGWTEARPYLTSSQFKKGKGFPHLSCSSYSKIDKVCSSRNRVSKSVIKLS